MVSKKSPKTNSPAGEALTLSNQEILSMHMALVEIAKLHIPVAGAIRVRNLIRVVDPIAKDVLEERSKLQDKYGKKREDGRLDLVGSTLQFESPEIQEEFEREFQALLAITAQVDSSLAIHASDLVHPDPARQVDVQPAALFSLGPMFVE